MKTNPIYCVLIGTRIRWMRGNVFIHLLLLEYLYISIWIAIMTILLWINDGKFSMIDRNIIILLAAAGMIHIRVRMKELRKR